MTRPSLLHKNRLLLLVTVCLGILLQTGELQAQSRVTNKTLDQRLQRVEKVLDRSLLELLQQVESLQRENRALRGEIEKLGHELSSQQQRNRDLYLDTDSRLGGLEDQLEQLQLQTIPSGDVLPGEEGEVQPGAADPTDGLEPQGDAGASVDNTLPAGEPVATDQEKQQYTAAYDQLASGYYGEAIQAFSQFLKTYPDGPLSDNAWYWMGEARYARREFEQAMSHFQKVVDEFPESGKVPDARLKIGYALYESQRYQEARRVLTSLTEDYPGRSAAVLAEKRLRDLQLKGQ